MQETGLDHSQTTAILVEKSGRFFFYEPGLALIVSDDGIKRAHEKFVDARQAFFEEADRAGLRAGRPAAVTRVARPAQQLAGRGVAAELGLFLAKICIVLLIVAGGGAAVMMGITPPGSVSMVDIADKAAVIVKDVQAMPQDRKDSLRQSITILSREAAPMIDAWRNPPP
jgi:hypothetical protein